MGIRSMTSRLPRHCMSLPSSCLTNHAGGASKEKQSMPLCLISGSSFSVCPHMCRIFGALTALANFLWYGSTNSLYVSGEIRSPDADGSAGNSMWAPAATCCLPYSMQKSVAASMAMCAFSGSVTVIMTSFSTPIMCPATVNGAVMTGIIGRSPQYLSRRMLIAWQTTAALSFS